MSLTVTSIVTVATVLTLIYFAVAQADDNMPVKKNNGAADSSSRTDDTTGGAAKSSMPVRGKRASFMPPPRHKRELTGTGITIPGTKWCGKGDIADHDDDLGIFPVEDSCCRTHDRCTDYIASGSKKTYLTKFNESYDVANENIYTISLCECDEKFKQCLEAANSEKGDEIGYWFFNWFHPKCLIYDHPLSCVQQMFYFWGPCTQQEPDTNRDRRWYLRDASYYKDATRDEPPEFTTETAASDAEVTSTSSATTISWTAEEATSPAPTDSVSRTEPTRRHPTSQITYNSVLPPGEKTKKPFSKPSTPAPNDVNKYSGSSTKPTSTKQHAKTLSPSTAPPTTTPAETATRGPGGSGCGYLASDALTITIILSIISLYLF